MSLLQTVRFSLLVDRSDKASRWSPAKVQRVAQKRLRSLLAHAVAHSPFYRRKYAGIDIARCELTDLPPLNKTELMEQFDQTLTDPTLHRHDLEQFASDTKNLGVWYRGKYSVCHTSGSQGQPTLIVQDRECIERLFGLLSSRANSMGRPGVGELIRRLRRPLRLALVTLPRGFYPSGAAFEFMPEFVGRFVEVRRYSSLQTDLVEQLRAFQPNTLIAYASILELLAQQVDDLKFTELRQVTNSSEQLTDRARQRISAAFGVPLLDHYGIGECLHLTAGCHTACGAHINADWAIVEVVDEQYRPVPPGELGHRVLVTNLLNRVQPFIRYEVGDRIALATTPCRCPTRMPRIDRIEGRTGDLFWTHDGQRYRFVSGPLFQVVADSLGEVREWQAVQHQRNSIEVRLEMLPGATLSPEAACATFRQRLEKSGLPERVDVHICVVPALQPDEKTGKLRRMISEVGVPDDLPA